ncbi:TetR/AcrR family transcriptional regulator [Qipengyuania sp. GH25]|uniref:TetR/AcrR family transcriptional regulator n=1 Tax=Qipengyuania pacifica TaxID=2860199 RepID=A0ABS7JHR1_9SPHN|nr:TetR/AcrR family transcriptional regulator [Qipengyuania aerophila]MBX7489562.1 TetR/AcrR family transcriptional regulator [Qipengyuania aerophila]
MPRTRKLDAEVALEAAIGLFWRKGFEGTSYADLVSATGVERPALYAAFGNKEALFLQALDRYGATYGNYVWEALDAPTSHEVVSRVLEGAVDLISRFADRPGCLGINGALAGSDSSESVQRALIEWRASGEQALRERFEQAQTEGDLPAGADPSALAAYILAVVHGMAVQAKAGFSRDKLLSVARQAMATWPTALKTKGATECADRSAT